MMRVARIRDTGLIVVPIVDTTNVLAVRLLKLLVPIVKVETFRVEKFPVIPRILGAITFAALMSPFVMILETKSRVLMVVLPVAEFIAMPVPGALPKLIVLPVVIELIVSVSI
jgi:hypothetical protein